jgi:hypothetical protein
METIMSILSGQVYNYVCTELPKIDGNYFEIGVFNGVGFARVAQENAEKKCYAVDPFIEDGHTNESSGIDTGSCMTQQKENFLKNTKDLDNITLFEMTGTEFANQLTDQLVNDMNISIVTIDGNHHYEHVVKDFDIAARLLNNLGGQIVVDDTNVAGVSQALNEFKEKFSSRISKEITAGGSTQVLFFKGAQ